jgi:hypothetical protein
MQTGIKKVVKITKKREIPSSPIIKVNVVYPSLGKSVIGADKWVAS